MKARSMQRRGGASHYAMPLVHEEGLKQHRVYRPLAGCRRWATHEEKDCCRPWHQCLSQCVSVPKSPPLKYGNNDCSKAALDGLVGTLWRCDRIGGIVNILLAHNKM
jgi:hypothetical protein